MPDFSQHFIASKGQPVEYKGRTIMMMDRYPLPRDGKVRLTLKSTASRWRQGIKLSAKGSITVAGQTIRKGVFLWEDTMPRNVELSVASKDGFLCVSNAWETGDGVAHSWHFGAAMYWDVGALGERVYHCNDGEPDEDFDDVVFSIIPLNAEPGAAPSGGPATQFGNSNATEGPPSVS